MTNMSVGFLDANGVWQYGELDPTGPFFSDFLALLTGSLSTTLGAMNAKAILQLTAATSTVTATATVVPWDSVDVVNSLPNFTYNRATGLIVCTVSGTYRVDALIDYASNTTGVRLALIEKAVAATPTVFVQVSGQEAAAALGLSSPTQVTAREYMTFAVGDVLRIRGYQSSGGNLNIVKANLELKKVA